MSVKQKKYMKSEYAQNWSLMRRTIYDYNSYDKFLLTLIYKVSTIKKKNNLLEACCGDGYPLANQLISKGINYSGFDISKYLIDKAKKNIGKKYFKVGDAEKIKYRKNSFNIVICFHSLWYIPNYQKALREMFRIIKPKGFLLFDTLNLSNNEIHKEYKKIIFESKNIGKAYRYLKNILKIIIRKGYTKWDDVIHQKPNDVELIIQKFEQNKMLKNLRLYGQKTPSSRLKLISRNQFNNIKNYQKIIFQCQKK